ncbi:hypothetical protein WJX74_001773 [Apatococcus lobatus]|uniref:Gluconokinase n=1 Tax=Apatococcus lobatus TaxID=904363 RepID=A0AAW1RQB2_9CHLO
MELTATRPQDRSSYGSGIRTLDFPKPAKVLLPHSQVHTTQPVTSSNLEPSRFRICCIEAQATSGVSGSGKSTVGTALAAELGCSFFDGDDFHPAANVEKMRQGLPLNDTDRQPWLQRLAALMQQHIDRKELMVVACSALKKTYRDLLLSSDTSPERHAIAVIALQPSKEELERRLMIRSAGGNHYMPASLLDSQLADQESDPDAMYFGSVSKDEIIQRILQARGTR